MSFQHYCCLCCLALCLATPVSGASQAEPRNNAWASETPQWPVTRCEPSVLKSHIRHGLAGVDILINRPSQRCPGLRLD